MKQATSTITRIPIRFISISWTDNADSWPGRLPSKLFDLELVPQGDTETTIDIDFSTLFSPSGYDLALSAAQVDLQQETLDVEGDGSVDLVTDGLLIMRYAFGFRGEGLIKDAIGAAATRTTAAHIENYLSGLVQ